MSWLIYVFIFHHVPYKQVFGWNVTICKTKNKYIETDKLFW